jgi:hypothetical protein
MPFDGTEGSVISPEIAGEWTRHYQESHPGGVRAYFAGRDILEQLLAQPDCMGIRVYYGLNGTTPTLVLVGADQDENDQIGENYIVADDLKSCPNRCSQANILNS